MAATLFFGFALFVFGLQVADARLWTSVERDVVTEINEERAAEGLHPVLRNRKLAKIADYRCPLVYENVNAGLAPHIGTGEAAELFNAKQGKFAMRWELAAWGYPNAEEAVAALMTSPAHRAAILEADADYIGASFCKPANMWVVWLSGPLD